MHAIAAIKHAAQLFGFCFGVCSVPVICSFEEKFKSSEHLNISNMSPVCQVAAKCPAASLGQSGALIWSQEVTARSVCGSSLQPRVTAGKCDVGC